MSSALEVLQIQYNELIEQHNNLQTYIGSKQKEIDELKRDLAQCKNMREMRVEAEVKADERVHVVEQENAALNQQLQDVMLERSQYRDQANELKTALRVLYEHVRKYVEG